MIVSNNIEVSEVVAPGNLRPKDRTYQNLLTALEQRKEPLSFSSMRSFMPPVGNPRKFLAYKLNKRKSTDAMHQGNVLDTMLTEGVEVAEQKYLVADKPDLRKKVNKEAWAEVQEQAQQEGKEICTTDDWENALFLMRRALSNPASRSVLDQITDTQVPVEGQMLGWNWRGYVDMMGPEVICDLKRKASAQPRKVYYQLQDANEMMQVFLYDYLSGGDRDLYSIVIDAAGDVCTVRYTESDKKRAFGLYEKYIQDLERCILKGDFYRSYDYWAPDRSGIFEYSQLR